MRNRRAALKKEKKITKVDQVCPTCEKTFQAYPCQNRIFCSVSCRAKSKEDKAECTCPECQRTFFAKPSRVKNGESIYCSRECYDNAHNVTRSCPVCGTDFSVIAASKQIYCSDKCSKVDRKLSLEEVNRRFRLESIELTKSSGFIPAYWRSTRRWRNEF